MKIPYKKKPFLRTILVSLATFALAGIAMQQAGKAETYEECMATVWSDYTSCCDLNGGCVDGCLEDFIISAKLCPPEIEQ